MHLAAVAPLERLLVVGPDAPPLAALIADTAALESRPIVLVPDDLAPAPADGVDAVIGEPDRMPLPDASVDIAILPHQLRHWDDRQTLRVLQELWRVLTHNGVAICWEIAPSRSPRINAIWSAMLQQPGRTGQGSRPGMHPQAPHLRRFAEIGRLAYDAGFAWVQTLPLRPFYWPPGPRVTVLVRKEHYTPTDPP